MNGWYFVVYAYGVTVGFGLAAFAFRGLPALSRRRKERAS